MKTIRVYKTLYINKQRQLVLVRLKLPQSSRWLLFEIIYDGLKQGLFSINLKYILWNDYVKDTVSRIRIIFVGKEY